MPLFMQNKPPLLARPDTPIRPSTTQACAHTVQLSPQKVADGWCVSSACRELIPISPPPYQAPRGSCLSTPLLEASWGSHLDLIKAQEADVMEVELGKEDEPSYDSLISEEDEAHVFVSMDGVAQPSAATVSPIEKESCATPAPPPSLVRLDV